MIITFYRKLLEWKSQSLIEGKCIWKNFQSSANQNQHLTSTLVRINFPEQEERRFPTSRPPSIAPRNLYSRRSTLFSCNALDFREVALTLQGKDVKRRFSLIWDSMIDCYPALLEDVIPKKRVHEKGKERKSADYSIIISSNCWN
ncbi:hypothetical protein CEXT_504891 [Caerostris extrusa]|uniref:Uncharacterized protein n=1 Tax=Caerostris extrusa TaxID=172846 RepID=A0AAV4UIU4_CAEEX|nr:hypothetical protein CEXT_504891 [Caerostris extrusa]